ncbi:hypothetical protein D3C83_212750 [compost metagenome]
MEALIPETSAAKRLKFLEEGLSIASDKTKDIQKARTYAEKILLIDPDNVKARDVTARQ